MDSLYVGGVLLRRVSPFGNPRIGAYLRLPVAYRSLSRPSSALSAKAFPLRSLQLNLVGSKSVYSVSVIKDAENSMHSLAPPLQKKQAFPDKRDAVCSGFAHRLIVIKL